MHNNFGGTLTEEVITKKFHLIHYKELNVSKLSFDDGTVYKSTIEACKNMVLVFIWYWMTSSLIHVALLTIKAQSTTAADGKLSDIFPNFRKNMVFFDFSLTVKAAPHECVIRTGQPYLDVDKS